VKPDIIALATSDSDFVPLIQEVRKAGIRVEVAGFVENSGTGVLLKSSGFIDLAVYYEGYLADQNGEQDEANIAEQYNDLIQSQNSEQDEQNEDDVTDQDQDQSQSDESDLHTDDVALPLDQEDQQTEEAASDIIEELSL
jgi:hypothetical protein